MPKNRDKQDQGDVWKIGHDDLTITDLLSYKLYLAANAISRTATTKYKREFNVSLGEWRALALLGASESLSLNQLARLAGFDKGQMSRIVAGLIERDMILREVGPEGGRKISLSLRPAGRALYEQIMKVAASRHKEFLSCLSIEEQRALHSALHKLYEQARRIASTYAEEADRQ